MLITLDNPFQETSSISLKACSGQVHQIDAKDIKDLEVLEFVLAHAGVVGEAGVAAHGQAHELAHEVILEGRAGDLRAVLQVLGADEADHGVDQQGLKVPRHRIGARFDGLLVAAVVGVGRQRAALPGLQIALELFL